MILIVDSYERRPAQEREGAAAHKVITVINPC